MNHAASLAELTPREERVIRLLFGMKCREGTGQPMTRKQAGDLFQVGVHRIEQIERSAWRKLSREGVRATLPEIAPEVRRRFVKRWLTEHPRYPDDPEAKLDHELLDDLI